MKKTIDIDGLKVAYTESGNAEGKPVILLHGWGCTGETLASVARILEPGMHVFAIDLPGHGSTPEPPEVWGVEAYTQLVEKFVEAQGLTDVSLIGHSFGGRISILMSSRRNVRKVVLVDAAGIKNENPKKNLKQRVFKQIKKLAPVILGKKTGNKVVDHYRYKWSSADWKAASPMMRNILSRCVNEDLKSEMPKIKAPTLLVWGENDTATPLSDAKTMEKLIPDAGLVAFPGCGHYSFLDNPIGFKAVIKEFFKKELS